jgi:hypothetical protein
VTQSIYSERRETTRYNMLNFPEVFDAYSNARIGVLLNLGLGGMSVLLNEGCSITAGQRYTLCLRYDGVTLTQLFVAVELCWSKKGAFSPNICGFKTESLNSWTKQELKRWIAELGFPLIA